MHARIWIPSRNPFGLPVPPLWWQQLVYDYDKMLRVFPSQRDRAYRLTRLVRREARLGLDAAVIHDHPDTRTCIQHGVVPVATLPLWAVSSHLIIRDLKARDLWAQEGGDPARIADAIERGEAEAAERLDRHTAAELDAINSDTFRHVRSGHRAQVDVRRATLPPLKPLPTYPGSKLPARSQGGSVIQSAAPPVASPVAVPSIILTD